MLKPLGDRVIVSVEDEEEKTVGGIVLASNAKEKPTTGKVVAAGPGATNHHGDVVPLTVKVDDNVMFDKYSGTNVSYDGADYLVLHEKDLLAIVE
ncbi:MULTISPECIES: co-chaperone GroES [Loigolactobacillus]|uniref:Co-chaperonin GroES n=1 Tax=Loigolactobacillus backii TaxID=375175 RepID=A0A192H2Y6_9LACO|nr:MULTISPECIES: co-chaperone GroES [Loigolactobacillus]ANK59180.1 co-chaperone GroES [Loigolactobacillus backii]ANK62592.1 co-chaperone GroES [Loigolactobacillus backii]ANK64170.1 co-chaperone GroES [Loigolactobacillus backii]ANK67435.1 co-chaperone GroES [Loigolactobacillus backii]ANK70397.1 co-chaperone GroES [Loigolactobacillus backii]